ncbi:helix-turn-helix transcriptional regulator [Paraburkholderia lycopersici]|uniref:AraC-type DNA-binding protein n=1 Tax=Paraburkholderia lycopersici TaxID=416944 RepID=A0A1G6QTC3_9BURK|nr:AraC family transcriptional regulator [Paraburkholderia lycopersici]SDC95628.1 AraC-type DNA-binding protein [Paraburkholderia lycopersici]
MTENGGIAARSTAPARTFNVDLTAPGRFRSGIETWFEILHDNYFPLDVKVGREFRSGLLTRVDIGEIRACTLKTDPMLTERRTSRSMPDGRDFYVVEIPRAASIRVAQRGRESVVRPGGFTVVNGAEGYTFETAQLNEVRTLRIPCRSLRARLPSLDDWVAKTRESSQPLVALFLDFAASYGQHGPALPPAHHERVEQHLLDLLVMALLGADDASSETSVRSAHRQRALRAIEQRFCDPALEPSGVARAIGVSERYLQKIFSERRETVSATIRARRILEAKRLLANRAPLRLSVTQIAYAVGFSDPAYFSRVFRQATGVSPVQYEGDAPRAPA